MCAVEEKHEKNSLVDPLNVYGPTLLLIVADVQQGQLHMQQHRITAEGLKH